MSSGFSSGAHRIGGWGTEVGTNFDSSIPLGEANLLARYALEKKKEKSDYKKRLKILEDRNILLEKKQAQEIKDLRKLAEQLETKLSLEQQPAGLRDNTCVVCMESQRDTVFMPCRHMCCCTACSFVDNCPLCRAGIDSKIKIWT